MSRIDELVERLCPDGVEYRELGEIATIRPGKDYKHLGEGTIPVYGSGGVMTYVDDYAYDKPTVLLPRKGSISNVFYVDEPFWNVDTIYYTEIDESIILPRYFYHVILSQHIERLNTSNAARPALTRKVLDKIRIPVPPLEAQEEIVRALDSFAELEADLEMELETELEARRHQYAHYRDELLRNLETSQTRRMKLQDVSELLSGFPFDSSKFQTTGLRLMRGVNVKRGYLDFTEELNRYWDSSEGLERYLLEAGDIIVAMDGSLVGKSYGMIAESELPLLLVQRVARIRVTQANSRYVFHCLANGLLSDTTERKKTAGAIPHISLKDIANIEISVPPLEEQERIVAILDRFDALVNDISQGLPAEIEARRKQYAYYRDKLLSFKEKIA